MSQNPLLGACLGACFAALFFVMPPHMQASASVPRAQKQENTARCHAIVSVKMVVRNGAGAIVMVNDTDCDFMKKGDYIETSVTEGTATPGYYAAIVGMDEKPGPAGAKAYGVMRTGAMDGGALAFKFPLYAL